MMTSVDYKMLFMQIVRAHIRDTFTILGEARMSNISNFAKFLDKKPKSGLYIFNGNQNQAKLEKISVERGFTFYYIDGLKTVDEQSFITELISNVEYPKWATQSCVGVVDVLSDIDSYPNEKSRVMLFDNFQVMAKASFIDFRVAYRVLEDITINLATEAQHPSQSHRQPFFVYSILRGTIEYPPSVESIVSKRG